MANLKLLLNKIPGRWRGEVLDVLIFSLTIFFVQPYNAQCISFLLAAVFYYCSINANKELNKWEAGLPTPVSRLLKVLLVFAVVSVILSIRGGLFFISAELLNLPVLASFLIVLFFTTALKIAVQSEKIRESLVIHSKFEPFFWVSLVLIFLTKLVHLGTNELLPEEAYYWNYAAHLSPGYLDHPPMIGWLIAAGTQIFGVTEFGVRFFPFLLSHATLVVLYFFSTRIFSDKKVAKLSVLIGLILPYITGVTFYATPDSPLLFFWALTIYIAYHLAVTLNPKWFYAAGITLGLGMLSKYTIVLPASAAVLFLLIDPSRRKLLMSKHFFISIVVAAFIFSPVIYWNFENHFASFAFQSTRRMASETKFSLHFLLLNALYLITPLGVWGVGHFFCRAFLNRGSESLYGSLNKDTKIFITILFAIPFSVFFLYSFRHVPKLNWIGPSFLVFLPILALQVRNSSIQKSFLTLKNYSTFWLGYGIFWCGFTAVLFYYLGLSLPLVPYSEKMHRIVGWQSFVHSALNLSDKLQAERFATPVMVGMDKHTIAAELLFYGSKFRGVSSVIDRVGSRNIINDEALMFSIWAPPEKFIGRDMLLFAKDQNDLQEDKLSGSFDRLTDIVPMELKTGWSKTKTYYYRIGYNYKKAE